MAQIADQAHTYDVLLSFNNCRSPVTTLVSAAVAATAPSFFILEIDQDDASWRDGLMTHPFTIKDGHLVQPDRPGLGSDLIEAELPKHPPVAYPGARRPVPTLSHPRLRQRRPGRRRPDARAVT